MILLGYCIRRAGEPAPDAAVRGPGGVAVELLEHGGLGIWLSAADARPVTPEALREHDHVVRAALRTATPLPLRFGSRFADEASARAMLEARADEWLDKLERVAGRVEMGVTLFWDTDTERERIRAGRPELQPAKDSPASGRDYLEGRRRAAAVDRLLREHAQALLLRVERSVGEGLPTIRHLLPRPGAAGTLAQLVPRVAVSAYRERAAAAGALVPGLRLALSGPWAPYSFV